MRVKSKIRLEFSKDELDWLIHPRNHKDVKEVIIKKYTDFLLSKKYKKSKSY